MSTIRAVKGMNDILPEEMPRWRRLEESFRAHVASHGFGEIRTPIVEPTTLFVRSIGETTDIVEKEMYTFTDKAEKSLTLRPEGTASCARAYLEANAGAKQPVNKWFYIGPMYRRERPAKGRYRQFYQAGCEIYGDPGPFCDAEMIDMVVTLLADLGIQDIEVMINSLGGAETRTRYREALRTYLEPYRAQLSEDSQRRLDTNPLRVLDSKAPQDQDITANAPSILELLSDDDAAHFDGLKATLDRLGTPYRVEPRLVRGLDYYTRTLFEVQGRGGELGAQNALLGGGRYDGMIEDFGGPATPAIGFAMGLERLLLAMPSEAPKPALDAMVLAARPELRIEATLLSRDLRRAGLRVENDLRGTSLKSQLRRADKTGASLALIVGEDELARGVVQWKRLVGQGQGEAPREGIGEAVKALLEG